MWKTEFLFLFLIDVLQSRDIFMINISTRLSQKKLKKFKTPNELDPHNFESY